MHADERIAQLRSAAYEVGTHNGYKATTRHMVALQAGVSPALVPFYLGDIESMRHTILQDGCTNGHILLILEGVINKESIAIKAAKKHSKQITALVNELYENNT